MNTEQERADFEARTGDVMTEPRRRMNSVENRLDRMRTLLAQTPMTVREIAAAMHVDVRSVYVYRDRIADEIRIAGWRRGRGGAHSPIYALGPGRDAPRLRPLSHAEAAKAWRRRIRTDDPARYEDMLADARARMSRQRPSKPRRDPAAVAIFGAPQ